ncbi:DUF4249 domain-containing protein [Salinimicrobium sp. TH3]|uniref:DUF4249 domain-containing protein n=1 Tax=Salinimicrobium sp. TH3 TaxID=2997342 RepID=UPI002273276E|nr:DUF4249 domain-containing protein [Salinimicrobium sp. TH3]MCY2687293.1 DUF4249 domain-containing protein [Salinimicrobium sp. TH3]
MKIGKFTKLTLVLLSVLWVQSCIEPYEFEAETFESALVVDGRITNQLKRHSVSLTRTYRFEENDPTAESNARVSVLTGQQEYLFEETEPGLYLSSEEFRASPGSEYQLKIETAGGKLYESEPEMLTKESQIEEITATKVINNQGETGVALQVYSNELPGEASFFRYEYEEDFKIQSPMTAGYNLEIVDGEITMIPKVEQEYICFGQDQSIDINVVNTSSFSQNRVDGHVIKFFEREDPKIAHRYSMLVKQFVISQQAYAFYNTLKELSQSESLFSQNQPGFLNGNIYSVSNPDEPVIGFFSVASETSKRTFFSFEEFFDPTEGKGSLAKNCIIQRPELSKLIQLVEDGSVKFLERIQAPAAPDDEGSGPYRVVPTRCMDCTVYGTNEVPEFWEE